MRWVDKITRRQIASNKNGARGSVFPCRIHPGRSALALPSLANKDLHRQLTAATTLCTGRAAPLSTCGNKPACDNALLVTNKNGARGSVVQCGINPGRNALRALPAPLPTSVCTTSYCDDVVHWKSDEPFLRFQPREERSCIMRQGSRPCL